MSENEELQEENEEGLEALKSLIRSSARSPVLLAELCAMERIDRAFQTLNTDFRLQPASEFNPEDVARAIGLATDKEVTKVIFVSRSQPFPKSEWMTQAEYEAFVDSILSCVALEYEGLWFYQKKLRENILDGHGADLEEALGDQLWSELDVDIFAGTRYPCVSNFESVLRHFVGFGIAGDRERAERFIPLLDLSLRAAPLWEKKDEPGTWLVLTA